MHACWIRPLLLLVFLGAAGALAGACSDETGDDDDEAPITPTRCALYWARENPLDDPPTLDVFTVDLSLSDWQTGTEEYGGSSFNARDGLFLYRTPDGSVSAAMSVGKTSSGEFQLVVQGTATGDSVSFVDSTAQVLVDARTMADPPAVGTGGEGSFAGVWSDPAASTSAEIDWASGASMTVTYLGSSITLGGAELDGMSAYGQCYDASAASAASASAGGEPADAASNAASSPSRTLFGSGTRSGKAGR